MNDGRPEAGSPSRESAGRRTVLRAAVGGASVLGAMGVLGSGTAIAEPRPADSPRTRPRTPTASLQLLTEGNRRWRTLSQRYPHHDLAARTRAISGQSPFAIVLGCVDSRVPPELVFDRGIGDLLTARSAAQVLDQAVVGSIEYGVLALGIPLVLVLGHQSCGAVKAAIEADRTGETLPGSIQYLAEQIRPAIDRSQTGDAQVRATTDAQIQLVKAQLSANPQLSPRIADGRLAVAGARYDLTSQSVHLLT
ncbi:carbonic anhydrase [Streptomyces sp. NPDC000594]|uniref:carbonic anhydrase n=1 Tax=Streptomyces sp. NPDC000594 TaxID=3154261 RepID=UPI003327747C